MRLLARLRGRPMPSVTIASAPAPTPDGDNPDAVRSYWISEVAAGRGMWATGWALAAAGAQHPHEVAAFLSDGMQAWSAAPGYDPARARRFAEQLVAELDDEFPAADGGALPSDSDRESFAVGYAARCWAASELLALGVMPVMEQRLYRVIAGTPSPHVPARSLEWALAYSALHGLPVPRDPAPARWLDQAPE